MMWRVGSRLRLFSPFLAVFRAGLIDADAHRLRRDKRRYFAWIAFYAAGGVAFYGFYGHAWIVLNVALLVLLASTGYASYYRRPAWYAIADTLEAGGQLLSLAFYVALIGPGSDGVALCFLYFIALILLALGRGPNGLIALCVFAVPAALAWTYPLRGEIGLVVAMTGSLIYAFISVATARNIRNREYLDSTLDADIGQGGPSESRKVLSRHDSNWRFQLVRTELVAATGYSERELTGKHLWDIVDPADAARVAEELIRQTSSGLSQPIKYRVQLKGDDEPVWVETTWQRLDGLEGTDADILATTRTLSARNRTRVNLRLLSQAVIQSNDLLLITDPDGRIEYVNPAFSAVSGYSLDEIRGKTPRIVKSDTTPAEVYAEMWTTLRSGNAWSGDLCNRRSDRSQYWVHATISPIRDDNGFLTHFVAVQKDITEKKHAELALQAAEERQRSILDNMPVSVWEFDASAAKSLLDNLRDSGANIPEYLQQHPELIPTLLQIVRVTYVNSAAVNLYAARSREELQDRFAELPLTTKGASIEESFGWLYSGRYSFAVEATHWTLDGRTIDVMLHVAVLAGCEEDWSRVLISTSDLTEVRAIERSRKSGEDLYRRIIEASQEGIWTVDDVGRTVVANQRMADMLAVSVGDLTGKSIYTFVAQADQQKLRDCLLRTRGGSIEQLAVSMRNHRNEDIRIMLSVASIAVSDDQSTGALIFAKDMTAQLRLELQMIEANKMEGIGRLAGGIAHDFNNILAVILSTLDLIDLDKSGGGPQREDISIIRRSALRASELTRQLLQFARKQFVKPRPVDLNRLIGDLDTILRRALGEDIELTAILPHQLWSVMVDPGQIEQVILNLAMNARDAMPQGGELTIETANVNLDVDYAREHPGALAGQHVLLSISDTGVGMDDYIKANAFEPFFTTKGVGLGTGLGLSTAYGIVSQAAGHIEIDSEPNTGTTIRILIPRCLAHPDALPESEDQTEFHGTETILVVEDEADLLSLVVRLLKQRGYTVLQANDGQRAIEVARAHAGNIDVLLTDVVMPRKGGRELAAEIRQLRPDIRVIYMSGYTGQALAALGQLDRFTTFIEKPFTPPRLLGKIREMLNV